MNKETLLQELTLKINSGEISREEVMDQLSSVTPVKKSSPAFFSVTKMFYVLGAAVVLAGLIIFMMQVWDDIGSLGRMTVTLGLGLVFAVSGSVLLKQKPADKLGVIFHFLGGMLIPGGALVTLHELGVDFVSLGPVALVFGVICGFYLLLSTIHKHPLLTFFAIANGTAFIYLLIEALTPGPAYRHDDLYAYLTMVEGASYLLLAQAFRDGWNKKLLDVLYFFGSGGFLAAAFSRVFDSPPWQGFFFLIVLIGLFLSARLKNRSLLLWSTLFLIAHVSYITSEYFYDSVGWPIALVILGFVFIALGYTSITINRRYIRQA